LIDRITFSIGTGGRLIYFIVKQQLHIATAAIAALSDKPLQLVFCIHVFHLSFLICLACFLYSVLPLSDSVHRKSPDSALLSLFI